jgi:hypothetical protein
MGTATRKVQTERSCCLCLLFLVLLYLVSIRRFIWVWNLVAYIEGVRQERNLYSTINEEYVKFQECLLLFSSKPYTFKSPISCCTIKIHRIINLSFVLRDRESASLTTYEKSVSWSGLIVVPVVQREERELRNEKFNILYTINMLWISENGGLDRPKHNTCRRITHTRRRDVDNIKNNFYGSRVGACGLD